MFRLLKKLFGKPKRIEAKGKTPRQKFYKKLYSKGVTYGRCYECGEMTNILESCCSAAVEVEGSLVTPEDGE